MTKCIKRLVKHSQCLRQEEDKMFFYGKLALSNIMKNKKLYFSYLLTSVFTMVMYYIISSLSLNVGLEGHSTLGSFMNLGRYVIIVFALIILLYANSFVIKRRKKEIALYGVLGMEKKHIMIMMFFETCIILLGSIFCGVVLGIIFSQLMYLVLINLLHMPTEFIFSIPLKSILETFIIFLLIFVTSLLFNLAIVKFSRPVELIMGSQNGEKEPKAKIIMTVIGLISLFSGYYIAISIDDPMTALLIFFVAVIFVVIGTYCLFVAGSITLLKLLKKNKRYYYQTNHFISLSSMIYRMKQNAVGLANICILCTCILVTLSSTVCLYKGIETTAKNSNTVDELLGTYDEGGERLFDIVRENLIKYHLEYSDYFELEKYEVLGKMKNNEIVFESEGNSNDLISIGLMTIDSFNKAFHQKSTLKDNEIIIYSDFDMNKLVLKLNNKDYKIKSQFGDSRIKGFNDYFSLEHLSIVVNNESIIDSFFEHKPSSLKVVGFNYEDHEKFIKTRKNILDDFTMIESGYTESNKQDNLESDYEIYGSFLFIGVFVSTMFLISAILIIYNKQLSEGFEDQKRFEILQNVGLSQKEVKGAIKSQVLIFFFLPLIVAIIHLCFAYPLILEVLSLFSMGHVNNYIGYCALCVFGLAFIYSVVYFLTARTYYSIVKR